ncbi:MAG: hypothetical protein ACPHUF_16330 [Gammaproteobacteria bacterium]
MVLDFRGFHPKFGRDGITRDLVFAEVAPLVRSAGYEIVTRGQVHDAGYRWTNVRLMAYWLAINENSATGLYPYRASLLALPKETLKLSLTTAMDSAQVWNRGENGLGPPSDMRKVRGYFVEMTRAFLDNRPGRRR